jgi:hypothetical protein
MGSSAVPVVVLPNTPAAVGVSAADMEKRMRGLTEKKQKLANPNFSVSKTRCALGWGGRLLLSGFEQFALLLQCFGLAVPLSNWKRYSVTA